MSSFNAYTPYTQLAVPVDARAPTSPTGSNSSGKRQRINMACLYCRMRRIKCTGTAPCNNCTRLGKHCDFSPVPAEVNRQTRERKAASKAKKMAKSSPYLSATSPSPSCASHNSDWSHYAHSLGSTSPSPESVSELHLGDHLSARGWSTVPNSPALSDSGFSDRPFPSVLTETPIHAAFVANSYRGPEEQSLFNATMEIHTSTPPRSPSPPSHNDLAPVGLQSPFVYSSPYTQSRSPAGWPSTPNSAMMSYPTSPPPSDGGATLPPLYTLTGSPAFATPAQNAYQPYFYLPPSPTLTSNIELKGSSISPDYAYTSAAPNAGLGVSFSNFSISVESYDDTPAYNPYPTPNHQAPMATIPGWAH